MRMQHADRMRVITVNNAVQLDRFVHPGVLLRGVVLDDVASKVEGEDIVGMQSSEGRAETVHQHTIWRDGHADMACVGSAQTLTEKNACRAADVELDLIEVDVGLNFGSG